MDLIVTGVVAGVLGTIMMDILNHLFARAGIVIRIDLSMIVGCPQDGFMVASSIVIQ